MERGRGSVDGLRGTERADGRPDRPPVHMSDKMSEQTVEITNELGIHARPAALFVKEAGRYTSDIFVLKNGQEVNGKSIMGIMMLAVECGSKITIKAKGPDSAEAVQGLVDLVRSKFGEE